MNNPSENQLYKPKTLELSLKAAVLYFSNKKLLESIDGGKEAKVETLETGGKLFSLNKGSYNIFVKPLQQLIDSITGEGKNHPSIFDQLKKINTGISSSEESIERDMLKIFPKQLSLPIEDIGTKIAHDNLLYLAAIAKLCNKALELDGASKKSKLSSTLSNAFKSITEFSEAHPYI